MTGVVTAAGGTIDKMEKWGKRRLAYRVEKHREGYYVLIQFTSGPETVKEWSAGCALPIRDQVSDCTDRRDAEASGEAQEASREARP